jgi:hypothetical protein
MWKLEPAREGLPTSASCIATFAGRGTPSQHTHTQHPHKYSRTAAGMFADAPQPFGPVTFRALLQGKYSSHSCRCVRQRSGAAWQAAMSWRSTGRPHSWSWPSRTAPPRLGPSSRTHCTHMRRRTPRRHRRAWLQRTAKKCEELFRVGLGAQRALWRCRIMPLPMVGATAIPVASAIVVRSQFPIQPNYLDLFSTDAKTLIFASMKSTLGSVCAKCPMCVRHGMPTFYRRPPSPSA